MLHLNTQTRAIREGKARGAPNSSPCEVLVYQYNMSVTKKKKKKKKKMPQLTLFSGNDGNLHTNSGLQIMHCHIPYSVRVCYRITLTTFNERE